MSNRKIDNLREPSNLQLKIQTGYPTAIDAKEGVVTLRYIPGTGLALFAYHANKWNMTKLSNMNAKDESIVENLKVKNLQIDKTAKFNGSSVDISEKNIPSIRKWDKSYNDIRSGEIEANFKKTKVKEDLQIGPDNSKILLKNVNNELKFRNADDTADAKIVAKRINVTGGTAANAGDITHEPKTDSVSDIVKITTNNLFIPGGLTGEAVQTAITIQSDANQDAVISLGDSTPNWVMGLDVSDNDGVTGSASGKFKIHATTDSTLPDAADFELDINGNLVTAGTITDGSGNVLGATIPAITVQTNAPAAISEFDSTSFIYSTSSNRLHHKVDSTTMAYKVMTEVSFIFSIDDVTFRTSTGGTTERDNAILVGTLTNMFVRVDYNNDDGTLDANPTISYKRNGSETDSIQNASHLGTSVTSNTHTSGTAFVVPQTDNASDSSADGALSRHCASGDYISAKVISIDGGVNSDSTSGTDDTSERYYFVNGMVWGSCAATTGPTQGEFAESFAGGIDNDNKGYKLPTLSGGAFSNSQYHSDLGTITIAADSGSEYIYFGYPDQGGAAATIKDSSGTDISGDFRTVQTADRENSAGYTETYNFYVSDNTGVSITDMVVT